MTLTPATRHITKLFRSASAEHVEAGIQWYSDAHEIAAALGVKNGVSIEIAVGVIAALSPMNSWGNNINLAARFLAAGGLHEGYLGANLAKGRAILAGADIRRTLNGDKVVNFYQSIITRGVEGVCIDRHAFDIAVNTRHTDDNRPQIKGKRYDAVADCYRRAARILTREAESPITPAQVQSVTWSLWRGQFWAAGAFDGHDHGIA